MTRFGVGKGRVIWNRVLFLPPELEALLPFDAHPRLRVQGEMAGVPVAGAFMPTGDGRRYVIVPPVVRKRAGVDIGDTIEMRFAVDDQDRVVIPEPLARELARDEDLRAAWERLSPGRRRGLVHPIHAARTAPTRDKRLREAIEVMRGGV